MIGWKESKIGCIVVLVKKKITFNEQATFDFRGVKQ